jgi:hypothetical protein
MASRRRSPPTRRSVGRRFGSASAALTCFRLVEWTSAPAGSARTSPSTARSTRRSKASTRPSASSRRHLRVRQARVQRADRARHPHVRARAGGPHPLRGAAGPRAARRRDGHRAARHLQRRPQGPRRAGRGRARAGVVSRSTSACGRRPRRCCRPGRGRTPRRSGRCTPAGHPAARCRCRRCSWPRRASVRPSRRRGR